MTEKTVVRTLVAQVVPCGQYRYRVEFPPAIPQADRSAMMDQAQQESVATFLECTQKYQALAWIGDANLAFAECRTQPSDRKSNFLHLLLCLKAVELGVIYARSRMPDSVLVLEVRALLPRIFKEKLRKLAKLIGVRVELKVEEVTRTSKTDDDSNDRRSPREKDAFDAEWIARITESRRRAMKKFSGKVLPRVIARFCFSIAHSFAWSFHVAARAIFQYRYRASFRRITRKQAGKLAVFLHVESRSGRQRDVAGYLDWKYDPNFVQNLRSNRAVIPFTHFSQTVAVYSLTAMKWSMESLRNLESETSGGCVTVNFLPSLVDLWQLRSRKRMACKIVRGRLRKLRNASPDFLSRTIYDEFRVTLNETEANVMVLENGYQTLFDPFPPGIVIQADALSKGARQVTASIRRRGGQAIYVADKICTQERTSNQLLGDESGNPHFPDRCVIFDSISRDELIRQQFPTARIHQYQRTFPKFEKNPRAPSTHSVLVLLQDYLDNLDELLVTGAAIAHAIPDVEIVFQEHPDFPVAPSVKTRIQSNMPDRLRFLAKGEKFSSVSPLCVITGYSTAAVPWVLEGVPLIWLRGQVDNSATVGACLSQIGFPSDSTDETVALVNSLRVRLPETSSALPGFVESSRMIFLPFSVDDDTSLASVLQEVIERSSADLPTKSLQKTPHPDV